MSKRFPALALNRILYFHAARADRLLHDVVTEVLLPQNARGLSHIDVREVEKVLAKWVVEGKTSGHWSEPTIRRIAQGLLSALRDFGVLQGAVSKRINPAYLPPEAFAYKPFTLNNVSHQEPSCSNCLIGSYFSCRGRESNASYSKRCVIS